MPGRLRHAIAVSRSTSKTSVFYDGRSFQEPHPGRRKMQEESQKVTHGPRSYRYRLGVQVYEIRAICRPNRNSPGTGCGNASASRKPRSPSPGSWRSFSTACGAMEPTSSGQPRRRRFRGNNPPEFRESGTDVPVGTAASVRSTQALRCLIEASAIHTLIRQRPPTP